jgi:Domain of unknown function (DUF4158)
MATRYKDRITILEDAEIEELYGRPRFTHDERVHYFALTPEERAVADGHYSLASRVLFILQAGYFKAKTLFFSFEIDEVADDVKHVLQQHYPQYHDTALKSAIVKQTRYAQQRKLLELYDYHACAGDERAALSARADQVVRISAKPTTFSRLWCNTWKPTEWSPRATAFYRTLSAARSAKSAAG